MDRSKSQHWGTGSGRLAHTVRCQGIAASHARMLSGSGRSDLPGGVAGGASWLDAYTWTSSRDMAAPKFCTETHWPASTLAHSRSNTCSARANTSGKQDEHTCNVTKTLVSQMFNAMAGAGGHPHLTCSAAEAIPASRQQMALRLILLKSLRPLTGASPTLTSVDLRRTVDTGSAMWW